MTRPGDVCARLARMAIDLESQAAMLDLIAGDELGNRYARAIAREGAVEARAAAERLLSVEDVVQDAVA